MDIKYIYIYIYIYIYERYFGTYSRRQLIFQRTGKVKRMEF